MTRQSATATAAVASHGVVVDGAAGGCCTSVAFAVYSFLPAASSSFLQLCIALSIHVHLSMSVAMLAMSLCRVSFCVCGVCHGRGRRSAHLCLCKPGARRNTKHTTNTPQHLALQVHLSVFNWPPSVLCCCAHREDLRLPSVMFAVCRLRVFCAASVPLLCPCASSATGTRARVARVRAEYPGQLDYSGCWLTQSATRPQTNFPMICS